MKYGQITIDGPAASGKSTIARLTAKRLDGDYINTGDMYRTLTWVARQNNVASDSDTAVIRKLLEEIDISYRIGASGRPQLFLNDQPVRQEDIRHPDIAAAVSDFARIPEVRAWMVERQRATSKLGLIIMEGRDIGTVIFPHAKYKFFLTATPEERARRRLNQAGESPLDATLESVAEDIARRDRIDSTRAIAPLRPADDAEVIDSTNMAPAEIVEHIVNIILTREEEEDYA